MVNKGRYGLIFIRGIKISIVRLEGFLRYRLCEVIRVVKEIDCEVIKVAITLPKTQVVIPRP